MKGALCTIAAAMLMVAMPVGARAQSAGDICDDLRIELRAIANAYDLAPTSLGAWCIALIEQVIEVSIPLAYGLEPSDVHPSEISTGLDRSLPGATAFLYNDLLYFPDADNPFSSTYRHQTRCAGATCWRTHPVTHRLTATDIRNANFSGRSIRWTVLGEKDGVTVVKREERTVGASGTDYDWTGYGAWATHNVFFSRWQAGVDGRYEGSGQVWSYSAGLASSSNPTAITARWDGFLTGVDVGLSSTRGNPIMGKAGIGYEYRAGRATVDVAFTEIRDLKTLGPRADMVWNDLSVRNGAFAAGRDSNSIQGRFYGRRHEEVGGIFERNRISGAFGARRN